MSKSRTPISAIIVVASLALGAGAAAAAQIDGAVALALAARIGDRSPDTSLRAKGLLGAYLDGRALARYFGRGRIEVAADSVECSLSHVDITEARCFLTFDGKPVTIKGRDAQALYATLIAAGLQAMGAAGSSHVALRSLDCTIDPAVVRERAGDGAICTFAPGL